jgi:hypothetical protein
MSKGFIATLAIVGVLLIGIITVGVMYVSASNTEVRLRNQAEAIQLDNQNEFDNMWKTISQTTQVTAAERESVERIILAHAEARGTGGGTFINAVRESMPNVDSTTFQNLQNIIVAARDRFTGRQRQLIDIKREHDNLLMTFPSSLFVGGRGRLEITVVTSTRTEETFRSGQDNDIDLEL